MAYVPPSKRTTKPKKNIFEYTEELFPQLAEVSTKSPEWNIIDNTAKSDEIVPHEIPIGWWSKSGVYEYRRFYVEPLAPKINTNAIVDMVNRWTADKINHFDTYGEEDYYRYYGEPIPEFNIQTEMEHMEETANY